MPKKSLTKALINHLSPKLYFLTKRKSNNNEGHPIRGGPHRIGLCDEEAALLGVGKSYSKAGVLASNHVSAVTDWLQ